MATHKEANLNDMYR